jgi:3-isopropylmalate/(R)-2-methylmalate dehydratase small subunit
LNRISSIEPFTTISGVAAPLPQANIDTDVIMPKQFLKGISRDDLARGLFYDLRFDGTGQVRGDFILNRAAYTEPSILIVGPNFGCGSSREHAVWGLKQFGIRCLLGTSFASIFEDNCFRNGLLPVALSVEQVTLLQTACTNPRHNRLIVDLLEQTITPRGGASITFAVDAMRRQNLIDGRDAIASTLLYESDIRAFESSHWQSSPWLKPLADRS